MTLLLTLFFWFAGQQAVDSIRCNDATGPSQALYCGFIEGVVVRAGSNVGIPNAVVTLKFTNSGPDAEGTRTIADSNGRFTFPRINPTNGPPEGYNISAAADGYVPAQFGQIDVNAPGETLTITRGQRRNLTIKLNPYPTISGTVGTPGSEPVAAALMRAYRIQYSPDGRRLKIARSALSNDLGGFHFLAMEPGDYYVSAGYSDRTRSLPVPGILLTPNLSSPDAGFPTTFYPAATTASDARAFTVSPTADRGDLRITLKESDRFTIRVHVFSLSNAPLPHFNVALLPAGADIGDIPDYAVKGNGGADFEIPYVEAGHYSLIAFDKSRILSEAVPIIVDHDQEVKIPVDAPLDIPGVVVDEFGNPIFRKMQVRLVRTDPELGQTFHADVDSGKFVMLDVGPGAYDVYVDGKPVGSYIKEVQFSTNDNHYGRIRIDSDKPSRVVDPETQRLKSDPGMQVVLTAASATVDGFVWNGARRTNETGISGLAGSRIVLVPDRTAADSFAYREDRFIVGSSNAAGHFELRGVPEGSYSIFGFESIPPGLYLDSQFIDSISDLGIRIFIRGPGQSFHMTACVPNPPPDGPCLLRVPRERSLGVSP